MKELEQACTDLVKLGYFPLFYRNISGWTCILHTSNKEVYRPPAGQGLSMQGALEQSNRDRLLMIEEKLIREGKK